MIRRSVLVVGLAALAACGSRQGRVNYGYSGQDPVTQENVNVRPGPMPSGDTFTGLYHSQEIGDVSLHQTGDHVVGCYEYDRAACHVRGRLEGSVEGNLLRFSWTEDQRACGRLSVPPGRGYFLLWKDSANNFRSTGEWGFGDEEAGNGRWNLFRVANRRPHSCSEGSEGEGSEGSSGGTTTSGTSGTSGTSSGSSSGTGTTPPSGGSTPDPLGGL